MTKQIFEYTYRNARFGYIEVRKYNTNTKKDVTIILSAIYKPIQNRVSYWEFAKILDCGGVMVISIDKVRKILPEHVLNLASDLVLAKIGIVSHNIEREL